MYLIISQKDKQVICTQAIEPSSKDIDAKQFDVFEINADLERSFFDSDGNGITLSAEQYDNLVARVDKKQKLELAVEQNRPDPKMKKFLTASKAEIFEWIDENGVNEAIWLIVLVLRYFFACKERVKIWVGKFG